MKWMVFDGMWDAWYGPFDLEEAARKYRDRMNRAREGDEVIPLSRIEELLDPEAEQ